jgi:hypothetical protein
MEYPYVQQGFRSCLDDAVRAGHEDGNKKRGIGNGDANGDVTISSSQQLRNKDEEANTATNTTNTTVVVVVDYATFKRKLKMYSQRRQKIRRLIDLSPSPDETIYVNDFKNILKEFENNGFKNNEKKKSNNVAMRRGGGGGGGGDTTDNTGVPYVPMTDDNDNEPSSGIWCGEGDAELKATKREQWKRHHRNNTQKTKIKIHRRNIMRSVSNIERNDIIDFLSKETEKLSLFYKSQLQIIQQQFADECFGEKEGEEERRIIRLNDVIEKHQQQADDDDAAILGFIKLGKNILDLYSFCTFNILVVLQLLIRYDGFARMYEGTPMLEFYMKTLVRASRSNQNQNQNQLHHIFVHEEVIALCDSYQKQIMLHGRKKSWSSPTQNSRIKLPSASASTPKMTKARKMIYDEFKNGRNTIQSVILSSSSSSGNDSSSRISSMNFTDDASASPTSISFRMIDFIRKYFLNDTMEDSLGWYLSGTNRGRNLTDEILILSEWKYESGKRWSTTSAAAAAVVVVNDYNNDNGSMLFELRSSSSNSIDNRTTTSCGGACVGNGFGLCGAFECGQCRFIEGEINLVGSAEDDENDDDYCFCGDGLGDSASTNGGDESDNIHESNTFDSILLAVTTGTGSSAYYKPDDYDHDHDVEKDAEADENIVSKQQKFNLFMSLAGAFLYCMNYYIVEPSSTMYVNALGANDAAGATLIGMMPIASFFSAIVYSVWTNKIYRSPFLVSCCLMVSGNIVYSSAFNYKSLSMALIGRFMTGLGGPKMIVRRYIADTTCLSIRTSVNALLGMVIAAGSALGPGCAIMLSNFDFIITIPRTNTELWFNAMTGPGWFMAVLWSMFSITLWWGFQEQERIGLKEKLQQETETTVQQQIQIVEKTIPTTSVTSSKSTKAIINDNRHNNINNNVNKSIGDEESSTILMTAKSCASMSIMSESYNKDERLMKESIYFRDTIAEDVEEERTGTTSSSSLWSEFVRVSKHLNFPVRLCLILLFAKVFVIEILVSCTSALSKNRYGWNIHEVGLLGCANGKSKQK